MFEREEALNANEARAAYEAKLAELQAFEASPPQGWNFIGTPSWEHWTDLKDEVARLDAVYQAYADIVHAHNSEAS
jgi:hypothetical protein